MKSGGDGRARPLSIFPDQIHIGDHFTEADTGDEEREWEVVSRPVTYKQGKEVRARVPRPGEPATAREQYWPAHAKITVRRNSAAVSNPMPRPAPDAGDADDIEALRKNYGGCAARTYALRRTRPSSRSASRPCNARLEKTRASIPRGMSTS